MPPRKATTAAAAKDEASTSTPTPAPTPTVPDTASKRARPKTAAFDFFDLGSKQSVTRIRQTAAADVDVKAAGQKKQRMIMLDDDDSSSEPEGLQAGGKAAEAGNHRASGSGSGSGPASGSGMPGNSGASGSGSVSGSGSGSGSGHAGIGTSGNRAGGDRYRRDVSLTPPPADLPAESLRGLDSLRQTLSGYNNPSTQFKTSAADLALDDDDLSFITSMPGAGAASGSASYTSASASLGSASSTANASLHSTQPSSQPAASWRPTREMTIKVQHQSWPPSAESAARNKSFNVKVTDGHRVRLLIDLVSSRTSIPSTDLVLTLRNVRLSATTLVFDSGVRTGDTLVSYTAADFEAMQTASAYAQASAEHASTNSQAASHHDTDAQEESSGFIVTVRTKESSAKIRVTLGTTMGQIAKKLGLEGRRFEFDGEKLDESTTIEEAGMEAMDIVEVR